MSAISILPIVNGVPSEPDSMPLTQRHRLWEAAKGLETEFSRYLLSEISSSVPGVQSMAGGEIFADMFRESLATAIAESQSMGLARVVYQEAARLAAANPGPP